MKKNVFFRNFKPLSLLRSFYARVFFAFKKEYRIGKYQIKTPVGFALPKFQFFHKLYDRFLPILTEVINSDKLIIDVGANVGDSTIAIIQKCKNPIISIEPSNIFFQYLQGNVERLEPEDQSRVQAIKKLVGTGEIKGLLKHSKSTATLQENDLLESSCTPLDKIVRDYKNVILLKIDTDGFDFDVILSSKKILHESKPILFWENQILNELQKSGFDKAYQLLEKERYSEIYIFDNFGNFISRAESFSILAEINDYLYSMEKNQCDRTFYYVDVLASTKENSRFLEKAIRKYKNLEINRSK